MFTCRSSAKVLAAAAATDDEMTIGLRGSKNKEQICKPQSHHHQHQQQTAIPVHTTRNCKMHCIPKATSSSSRCLRDLIFVFPYWTAVNASSQAALPATRDETLVNNKRGRDTNRLWNDGKCIRAILRNSLLLIVALVVVAAASDQEIPRRR